METNSRHSGTRNLEAESIRSRAERGWCLNLKLKLNTATEGRWSNVHDTLIGEYFILHSWWDWEPVKRLKLRSGR